MTNAEKRLAEARGAALDRYGGIREEGQCECADCIFCIPCQQGGAESIDALIAAARDAERALLEAER
jgi:hypothetical protein